MFLLHYIIPIVIFYFYRSEIMLAGLLFGNLIDLDHVIYRCLGEVPWLSSACGKIGEQCSWGTYPTHNIYILIAGLILTSLIFSKNKYLKLIGWIGLGVALNLILDYVCMLTGITI